MISEQQLKNYIEKLNTKFCCDITLESSVPDIFYYKNNKRKLRKELLHCAGCTFKECASVISKHYYVLYAFCLGVKVPRSLKYIEKVLKNE